MSISDSLLPEFDYESASTRKMLERVPDGKFDFRPHPKSMTMGELASHMATIPLWGISTLEQDSFDVAPVDGEPWKAPTFNTVKELVDGFDQGTARVRAALARISDADMMKPWSLLKGGKALFTMPRVEVLRSFIFNHAIHHRAQLGVYLRMNDIPLPAIYGPSADDGTM